MIGSQVLTYFLDLIVFLKVCFLKLTLVMFPGTKLDYSSHESLLAVGLIPLFLETIRCSIKALLYIIVSK
ncbi:hypothetical protein F5X96DRAFT_661231 [Biscogniauxia mediterranea]|nr:hypothetical protein F5X96DRAFT_661231 [Biscogniauxia mediterranea]